MPYDPLDSSQRRDAREFVDRDPFKEAFDSSFDALDPARNTVLMFHGVGGIGKTALLDHLRQQGRARGADVAIARVDFTERESRLPTRALAQARSQFHKHGVPFPSFDVAYAHYWRLAYPEVPLAEAAIPLLDDGEMVTGILDAAKEVPGLDLVSKIPRALGRLGQVTRDWWVKRGSEELRVLIGETDPGRVADHLRVFWASDVTAWLTDSPDHRRAVLFLDTLEALGEADSTGVRGATPDDWVRHWVGRLPGVLIVAAGRQRLRWQDRDPSWDGMIEQHVLGGLAPEDAEYFLKAAGVSESDVRTSVVEKSQGVPFYLDLAVDTYHQIQRAEARPPRPDEFDANLEALLDRFLHYLPDAQRATITALSVPSTFDVARYRDLVTTFSTGTPATAEGLATLRAFSFVEELGPGRYALHNLVREALAARDARDADRAEERQAVHRHLLAQAKEILGRVDVRAITEADERALREATEHQKVLLPVGEWIEWYQDAEEPLVRAARWTALLPLREDAVATFETSFGSDHPYTLLLMNNLGYVRQNRGDLAGAEHLFRRAIEGLGPDHPSTLDASNNLGAILYARSDLAGAETLFRQTFERRKSLYGLKHTDTLTSANNLARLLHAQGHLAEAESLHRQVLRARESLLGPDDPLTLLSVNNLGDI